MAKIALEKERQPPRARLLAQGEGWTVSDVICTAGPHDRPFEERHSNPSIAIVLNGTFQYRSQARGEIMTPGSLLLGNAGQCFECGHEHGTGDRCLAFSYTPGFFERLIADAGVTGPGFRMQRLPPLRALSPMLAQASAATPDTPWNELAVQLAVQSLQLDCGLSPGHSSSEPGAEARVTRVLRKIEGHPDDPHQLDSLAREARLSPYHLRFRRYLELQSDVPG